MGQGGGLVSISAQEKEESKRRSQEPGACGAREFWAAFRAAVQRTCPEEAGAGEIIPNCGRGEGFTGPCARADCEVPPGGIPSQILQGVLPCSRWVRLAAAAQKVTPT